MDGEDAPLGTLSAPPTQAGKTGGKTGEEAQMRRFDQADPEFWARLTISMIFVVAGIAVLLFGVGEQSSAKMAAGWLGGVLGFWLR
jgi:hypothetical protein